MHKKLAKKLKVQSAMSPLEATKFHTLDLLAAFKQQKEPLQNARSSFTGQTGCSQKPMSPVFKSQQFCVPKTLLTLLLLLPSCAGPHRSQSLASATEPARVRTCACFHHVHHLSYQHMSNIYPDLITIHLLMLQRCRIRLFIVLNKHVALSKKNAHGRNMKLSCPCLNH